MSVEQEIKKQLAEMFGDGKFESAARSSAEALGGFSEEIKNTEEEK